MPKGPQGQKRPADAIARAVMVARIATGEIEDTTSGIGRAAGGKARAMVLSSKQRKDIASAAAKARWQGNIETDINMTHTTTKEGSAATVREAVRMYPNNSLREPVRPFENSILDLVKKTFTK